VSLHLELENSLVTINAEKWKIQGKLVFLVPGCRGKAHKPSILIVQNRMGQMIIVRSWDKIVPEAS